MYREACVAGVFGKNKSFKKNGLRRLSPPRGAGWEPVVSIWRLGQGEEFHGKTTLEYGL